MDSWQVCFQVFFWVYIQVFLNPSKFVSKKVWFQVSSHVYCQVGLLPSLHRSKAASKFEVWSQSSLYGGKCLASLWLSFISVSGCGAEPRASSIDARCVVRVLQHSMTFCNFNLWCAGCSARRILSMISVLCRSCRHLISVDHSLRLASRRCGVVIEWSVVN